MQQTSSMSLLPAVKLSATPVERSATMCTGVGQVETATQRTANNAIVADLSLDDGARQRVLDLSRCSSRNSPIEFLSTKNIVRAKANGSNLSVRLNNNIPLSYSSRGLDSTVCTDDGEDYDEVEDDGSVGSCTAHDADVTPGATKAALLSDGLPSSAVAATRSSQAHADPVVAQYHFSSLASMPKCWSVMRKVGAGSTESSNTRARNSDRSGYSSSSGKSKPPSTVSISAGSISSSSDTRQKRSMLRFAVHEAKSGDSGVQLHSDHLNGSSSSNTGCWTLAPRLRGVNETLLATRNSQLFREALDALHVWNTAVQLELHHNSAGGTYMVRLAATTPTDPSSPAFGSASSPRGVLCVFKPRDEEIGQESNPHGNHDSDRTEAFAPGSGSRREVLAYRLDHGHNAGVPPTLEVASSYVAGPPCEASRRNSEMTMNMMSGPVGDAAKAFGDLPSGLSDLSTRTVWNVRDGAGGDVDGLRRRRRTATTAGVAHKDEGEKHVVASTLPQIGSLQLFFSDCQEAADVLPGHFDTDEVHALAIFDIRTLNGDRHGGNVLVQNFRRCPSQQGPTEAPHLIPIDHSYVCPSGYADPDYEWLSWPQAKKPFSSSNLQYIAALDAEADAELVRSALLAHSGNAPHAHNSMVTPAGGCSSGGGGGADIFGSSVCTVLPEAEGAKPALAASCMSRSECASERTRELMLLGDGVLLARAVVQECGVSLDVPLLFPDASCAEVPPLQEHYCGSFNDLTIYSPVRNVNDSMRNAYTVSAAADFGSPPGFSMTVLPGLGGSPPGLCGNLAGGRERWEAAGALSLGLRDRVVPTVDYMSEGYDEGVGWETSRRCRPPSTPHASSASLSCFPPLYEEGGIRPQCLEAENAVTYDKGAASAAAEVMRCTTRLLQIAALEFDMTAYEIGSLCRRPRVAQASFLEEVMEEARDEFSWEVVLPSFDALVRQRLAATLN
ncbi:hypothetical protein ABL78_0992 [Leptomonas seymouri]|uniref:PI3K/PI4K catalytic domain-containing protein n=1 Tax=Leptomonas seymouri TaxID=5684 RepID=A0A0N1PD91_LEPSE|nr:hypothetical protein ABL78_0992 [Leptomonas seymouri]|eukprot:KPI89920.1 hypothetical protein ABL78_0992 [Leptomonas seymouri]